MIQVVCAIIQFQDKILITQRSAQMKLPLKWEFPGGKINDGEDHKSALQREILEELNMQIEVGKQLTSVQHHYPDFSIELIPYLCATRSNSYRLEEHAQADWVQFEELKNYDFAEADLPIVDELKSFILSNL